jgi:hypothetical protein
VLHNSKWLTLPAHGRNSYLNIILACCVSKWPHLIFTLRDVGFPRLECGASGRRGPRLYVEVATRTVRRQRVEPLRLDWLGFPTTAQTARLPVPCGTIAGRRTRHHLPSGLLPRVIPSSRLPTRPASGPQYRPAHELMLRPAGRAGLAGHRMSACTSPNCSQLAIPRFACVRCCLQ